MKSITHILYNTFTHDTRVLKELESLASADFSQNIYLVALGDNKLPKEEKLNAKVTVYRLTLWTKKLPSSKISTLFKLIEWHLRVFLFLKNKRPEILHVHDIIPLFSGMLYKLFIPTTLIYDSHEFQSEVVIAQNSWRRYVYRLIEQFGALMSDGFITVSPSIQENYKYLFNFQNQTIIMNCPKQSLINPNNHYFRNRFNLKETDTIFLYQGGLIRSRGVNLIIDCFKSVPDKSNHVIFMGLGPMADEVQKAAETYSNIHFHPAVDPFKVVEFTSTADVGITLTDYSCRNHLFSLPNKLFDYIQAEIPIIGTNLTSVKEIIETHRIGIIINEINESNLMQAVVFMKHHHHDLRESMRSIKVEYVWENEEKKLIDLYLQLSRTINEKV